MAPKRYKKGKSQNKPSDESTGSAPEKHAQVAEDVVIETRAESTGSAPEKQAQVTEDAMIEARADVATEREKSSSADRERLAAEVAAVEELKEKANAEEERISADAVAAEEQDVEDDRLATEGDAEERGLKAQAESAAEERKELKENQSIKEENLAEVPAVAELRLEEERPETGETGATPIASEEVPVEEQDAREEQPRATEASSPSDTNTVGGVIIAGDYYFTTSAPNVECVLRIRPSGQWHHSVHRTSIERGRIVDPKMQRAKKQETPMTLQKAYKLHGLEDEPSTDMDQFKGDYEEFEVWELAEATGYWREVQVRSTKQAETAPEVTSGVLLTCENCSWKASHPNAPLTYCPSDDSRLDIEAMFQSEQLVLCFRFSQSEDTGQRHLELHMDLSTVSEWTGVQVQELPEHVRIRSLQTSFQTLGFTRLYNDRPSNM